MLAQISIGFGIVILSVVIQVTFIEFAARRLRSKFGSNPMPEIAFVKFVTALSMVTIWLLIGIVTVVAIWTFLFLSIGVFTSIEESFYFSLVSFTTLGFGDITLPSEWRVLSGFVATDGFLLFGLNTAVMLEIIIRLRGHLDDVIIERLDS